MCSSDLTGNDGLATNQFPQITFISTQVTPQSDRSATVHGVLTLHGVSKPAILQMLIDPATSTKQHIYFTAIANVSRSEWNMGDYPTMADDNIELKVRGRIVPISHN